LESEPAVDLEEEDLERLRLRRVFLALESDGAESSEDLLLDVFSAVVSGARLLSRGDSCLVLSCFRGLDGDSVRLLGAGTAPRAISLGATFLRLRVVRLRVVLVVVVPAGSAVVSFIDASRWSRE